LIDVSWSTGCSISQRIGRRVFVKPLAASDAIYSRRGTAKLTLGSVLPPKRSVTPSSMLARFVPMANEAGAGAGAGAGACDGDGDGAGAGAGGGAGVGPGVLGAGAGLGGFAAAGGGAGVAGPSPPPPPHPASNTAAVPAMLNSRRRICLPIACREQSCGPSGQYASTATATRAVDPNGLCAGRDELIHRA